MFADITGLDKVHRKSICMPTFISETEQTFAQQCAPKSIIKRYRTSDEEWKTRALNLSIQDLKKFKCKICCEYGQVCFENINLSDIGNLQTDFWNDANVDAPVQRDRKLKIKNILYKFYDYSSKTYTFMIGERKVCETAFLLAIGLTFIENNLRHPKQWIAVKKQIEEGFEQSYDEKDALDHDSKKLKQDKCIAFIQNFIDLYCDSSAYAKFDDTKIFPFDSFKTFKIQSFKCI